jgi:hypothetical protein
LLLFSVFKMKHLQINPNLIQTNLNFVK